MNQSQKPVAYDAQGRPLYAAPPQTHQQTTPPPQQVVHMARRVEPVKQTIPESIKMRHEESLRKYPGINLSANEYIVSVVNRHPIGLVLPIAVTVFLIAMVIAMAINYPLIAQSMNISNIGIVPALIMSLLLVILFSIGGYVAVWIYMQNKFFLTNESVIQELQTGIFNKKEQTVSLANIEDASFTKHGLLQYLFNYGSIRLSTQGDETTYRFSYVANPKQQIAILNNAVEAFKNGRAVGDW